MANSPGDIAGSISAMRDRYFLKIRIAAKGGMTDRPAIIGSAALTVQRPVDISAGPPKSPYKSAVPEIISHG